MTSPPPPPPTPSSATTFSAPAPARDRAGIRRHHTRTGSYSYSYSYYGNYTYDESGSGLPPLAPPPPAPPPNSGSTCYLTPWQTLPGCTCHPSCATCGYFEEPTAANDCITCRHGGPVEPVWDDGTGKCVAVTGDGQDELLTSCYKLCDRDAEAEASDRGGECTDSCYVRGDGFCDDGGPSADYNFCSLGTDCTDCGSRRAPPAPPKSTVASPPPPLRRRRRRRLVRRAPRPLRPTGRWRGAPAGAAAGRSTPANAAIAARALSVLPPSPPPSPPTPPPTTPPTPPPPLVAAHRPRAARGAGGGPHHGVVAAIVAVPVVVIAVGVTVCVVVACYGRRRATKAPPKVVEGGRGPGLVSLQRIGFRMSELHSQFHFRCSLRFKLLARPSLTQRCEPLHLGTHSLRAEHPRWSLRARFPEPSGAA